MLEENMKTQLSVANSAASNIDIKSLVEKILFDTNYTEARAAKMEINDFLALLSAFNAKGIHFT
jgi:18S rRNA (adenine1779-N6/adenine1780-N6)-dimethyltransferase